MRFQITQTIQILRATPNVLKAMLDGLDDEWILNNYGEKTFSPFDVVGHLIHGERTDWIPRAKIILEHGEARAFDPFDRYAMYEDSRGKTIADLLSVFAELRAETIQVLQAFKLTADDLAKRSTHPPLGTVTLENLLSTWVTHDLNHIHQIAKCLAYQYQEFVGPWREYITVLPR